MSSNQKERIKYSVDKEIFHWCRINISLLIIITIIILDLFLVYQLIYNRIKVEAIFWEEGFKQLWEICLAIIGGGLIGLVFSAYQKEREAREVKREYLKSLFTKSVTQYNNAKKIRRLIRAKVRFVEDNQIKINIPQYIELMTQLEDCQLEFESLKREMEQAKMVLNVSLATKLNLQELEDQSDLLQKYLNQILSEFEKQNIFKNSDNKIADNKFIKVIEFSDPDDKNDFESNFSEPFNKILNILIQETAK